MSGSEALLVRITALEAGLRQARHPLTDPGMEADRRLRNRIQVRIGFLIDQELDALLKLRSEVKANDEQEPTAWERFSNIRAACRPLFRECLALIEGTSTRRSGLDQGLCAIADTLLDDLSYRSDIVWGRFTILDSGESFGEMAEIIRLRFPQTTLWDLPVAAHEFGHFLALHAKRRGSGRSGSPFLERLNSIKAPQLRLFLHEHFADVAATVALGPAWAFTALLLRLDPSDDGGNDTRQDPRSRHPPDDDRAQVILAALLALDHGEAAGAYKNLSEMLADKWCAARQAAGRSTDERAGEAGKTADYLLEMISETLPGDLHFTPAMWQETESVAAALGDPGGEPVPTSDMTLQRVLNAAWRARLRGVESIPDLERRGLSLCKQVAARLDSCPESS